MKSLLRHFRKYLRHRQWVRTPLSPQQAFIDFTGGNTNA